MSSFSPDLWKEAADIWMCIWKFRDGPWKLINRDIAKMIQRKIYETYLPPFKSELMITTFSLYEKSRTFTNKVKLDKNIHGNIKWVIYSSYFDCCITCNRPLLWKSKDYCRNWCPVHGHPSHSLTYI